MDSNTNAQSAKIYQFPIRARPTTVRVALPSNVERMGAAPVNVVMGNCWYHEAAISQSATPKKS